MYKKLITIFVFLLPLFYLTAQVKVKIVSIDNNLPLKQAAIYDDSFSYLGRSDSLGFFEVGSSIDKILIIAKGFEIKIETIGKLSKTIFLFESYKKKTSDAEALHILQKSWENRTKNNPEHLRNYQFKSYVKFTLDMSSDSITVIPLPKTKLDSISNYLKNTLQDHIVFIGERNMTYKYDHRYGKKSIVKAYKVAGFENPGFFNVAISESLVNNYPEILKPDEIQNSVSKLVDSTYINGRKTYKIFTYAKGKEDSQLYRNVTAFIDAETYALVQLLGNTSKVSDTYYELSYIPYQNVWFAQSEYMKTQVLSKNFIAKINKLLPKKLHSITKISTTAVVESNYSDFQTNLNYTANEFKGYEYEIAKDALENADSKILETRPDSLTSKEAATYTELDRLSSLYDIEAKLRFLRSLASNELELGFLNFHIYELVNHSLYEAFRFQLGAHTNYKLSKNFRYGGYVGISTRDGKIKGGVDITAFINKKQGGELSFKAESDVLPAGRTKEKYLTLKDELTAKSNNIYNDIFFSYNKLELSYKQDFFKTIDITFSTDYQRQKPDFDYSFKGNPPITTWYNYVNTSIKLRYAPNVKYIQTVSGKNTLKDKPPYYYLTYSKSWNLFDNSSASHKLYLSVFYNLITNWGTTEIVGNAGAIFRDTPIMNTYEGMGGAKNGTSLWGRFGVTGFQVFETMNSAVYFSDQFASIQIKHHLKPIRVNEFKSLYFALVYRGLIGTMENKDIHSNFEFEIPKHYYQEIGLEANKLLLGILGVATYYRLGAYQEGRFDKNLYLKLSISL